jgi:two-component system OmpR family sensor kinase
MMRLQHFGGWVIDWKRYERSALLKFMAIYMATSFVLLSLIAILYYLDVRKDAVINVRTEMLTVLYTLRKNPNAHFERFHVMVDDVKDHIAPSFRQYDNRFELVACANPHFQNKVFVITAPLQVAFAYTEEIFRKIIAVYMVLFIPFFLLGTILARLSLKPLKKVHEALLAFNADVIHDLKTPITTIGINAELLGEDKCKPLCRIESSIKTLEGLYLNLETYLRTGEHLHPEMINLNDLILERVELFRSLYPSALFNITIEPTALFVDKISITRILDNLVTNAIKYGGKKPIVTLKTDKAHLFVSDNGKGMEHLDKIFDRHYRECTYVSGYGLGLNIVKTLTQRLGITIQVVSSPSGTDIVLDISSLIAPSVEE